MSKIIDPNKPKTSVGSKMQQLELIVSMLLQDVATMQAHTRVLMEMLRLRFGVTEDELNAEFEKAKLTVFPPEAGDEAPEAK